MRTLLQLTVVVGLLVAVSSAAARAEPPRASLVALDARGGHVHFSDGARVGTGLDTVELDRLWRNAVGSSVQLVSYAGCYAALDDARVCARFSERALGAAVDVVSGAGARR